MAYHVNGNEEPEPPVSAAQPKPDGPRSANRKRNSTAIKEALANIQRGAEAAALAREETFSSILRMLERVQRGIRNMDNAGYDINESGGAMSPDTGPDDGDSDGLGRRRGAHAFYSSRATMARALEEKRKYDNKTVLSTLHGEWEKHFRRGHWFITGAIPIDHEMYLMQCYIGSRMNVTKKVHTMLSELTGFRVHEFKPRYAGPGDDVPIYTQMRLMAHAVVALARMSVPEGPESERTRCLKRVRI